MLSLPGNEKWCCGDMPHFDLGKAAFARLASNGKGIIGLKWRPVPCAAADGDATKQDWKQMWTAVGRFSSLWSCIFALLECNHRI